MKKVLVVDDDPDILFVVKHILTDHGFKVQTHPTGLHVPALVRNFKPNLILLDVLLPGKSGTEICEELKKSSITIPIILFSAHAAKETFAKCKANDFIRKPFDLNEFVNKIKLYTD